MKRLRLMVTAVMTAAYLSVGLLVPAQALAASCSVSQDGSFLGMPTWYKYLPGRTDEATGKCRPDLAGEDGEVDINSALPILLAIVDILLRVAGLAAVVYVIYGGYKYLTSQGNPEGTNKARQTILNAFIGLALTLLAIGIVSFIGRTLY